MTAENELADLRKRVGVTQAIFADFMGVPLRTYEDLEGGRSSIRPVHVRAAQMATLKIAANRNMPDALPAELFGIVNTIINDKIYSPGGWQSHKDLQAQITAATKPAGAAGTRAKDSSS